MTTDTLVRQKLQKCIPAILQGSTDAWDELRQVEQQVALLPQDFLEHMILDVLHPRDVKTFMVSHLLKWFAQFVEKPNNQGAISEAVLNYMRDTKYHHIQELTLFLSVLHRHSLYLPLDSTDDMAFNGKNKCTYLREMCTILVRTLTKFNFSNKPSDVTITKECINHVENFLEYLVSRVNENFQLIMVCLKTLYNIISDQNQKQGPGIALVVLKLVDQPKQFFSNNFDAMEHNDAHLARALMVLSTNLPYWPGGRISVWIIQLIQGFEDRHKYDILNEYADEILPKIFYTLQMSAIRTNSSQVIFYILKRQATPVLLNKLANQICNAYKFLNNESAKDCLQDLVDVVYALVLRFPNNDMNKLLRDFPVPPQDSNVNKILNQFVWESKVGLTNLGNTCYMNSVLQALFMTRQFCHEVLNHNLLSEASEKGVLRKLQNLFALLTYSKRNSWAPTEILQVCRPSYFIAGQQQDSSEFLCHLLDVLHEQEKSNNIQYSNSDSMIGPELKIEIKDCGIITVSENISVESVSMKRWITEENLSEGVALERKTQSLADFTKGDELSQTQNLSDSHSDSTDSGIQSVGGEDTGQGSLVHRVFGGQTTVTYQCKQCETLSRNTDKFRDLQLCFPEEICENEEVSVQDLINYYFSPETLTGDNKYRCDKCTKLCDAQRFINILQAPVHLILTLKHFRFDSESRLRTKLRHKVVYSDTVRLKVCMPSGEVDEEYRLYAAVVHSGYSMDYGHYFTYASDAKNNKWYKFNDSHVTQTTFDDFKRLEPPDTPYILFYSKAGSTDGLCDVEDKPELLSLSKRVQDLVREDLANYAEEMKQLDEKRRPVKRFFDFKFHEDNHPDDDNPPSSTCRGPVFIRSNKFLY